MLELLRENAKAEPEALKEARLELDGPYYQAAVLQAQPAENTSPSGAKAARSDPFSNSNLKALIQASFSAEEPCYIVEYMERNCFILLFSQKSDNPELFLKRLQNSIKNLKVHNLQAVLYVGNAYSSLELISQSFHEAKTAFINRNSKKDCSVYFYGNHPAQGGVRQQIYPTADLNALCSAIDQENSILVEFLSTELLQHIDHLGGDSFTVRCVCYDTINRIFQTMEKKSPGWMKRISGEIANNFSTSSLEDLRLILQTLCSQIILDIKAKPVQPKKLSMKDATAYIDAHFCDADFSVKGLAANYKISVSNFSHQFKNYTGKTVSDYINYKKIQYAKKLFRETGGSVSEVAAKVGYFHTSSFIRKYKQEEGITPGEYLDQLREKTIAGDTEDTHAPKPKSQDTASVDENEKNKEGQEDKED